MMIIRKAVEDDINDIEIRYSSEWWVKVRGNQSSMRLSNNL